MDYSAENTLNFNKLSTETLELIRKTGDDTPKKKVVQIFWMNEMKTKDSITKTLREQLSNDIEIVMIEKESDIDPQQTLLLSVYEPKLPDYFHRHNIKRKIESLRKRQQLHCILLKFIDEQNSKYTISEYPLPTCRFILSENELLTPRTNRKYLNALTVEIYSKPNDNNPFLYIEQDMQKDFEGGRKDIEDLELDYVLITSQKEYENEGIEHMIVSTNNDSYQLTSKIEYVSIPNLSKKFRLRRKDNIRFMNFEDIVYLVRIEILPYLPIDDYAKLSTKKFVPNPLGYLYEKLGATLVTTEKKTLIQSFPSLGTFQKVIRTKLGHYKKKKSLKKISEPVVTEPVVEGSVFAGPVVEGPVVAAPVVAGPLVVAPDERFAPALGKKNVVAKKKKPEKEELPEDYNVYVMYMISRKNNINEIIGTYDGIVIRQGPMYSYSTHSTMKIHPKYRNMELCFTLAYQTYCSLVKKFQIQSIIVNTDTQHPKNTCRCYVNAAKKCNLKIISEGQDITNEDTTNYCNFQHTFEERKRLVVTNPKLIAPKDKNLKELTFFWLHKSTTPPSDPVSFLEENLNKVVQKIEIQTVDHMNEIRPNVTLLVGIWMTEDDEKLDYHKKLHIEQGLKKLQSKAKHIVLVVFHKGGYEIPKLKIPVCKFELADDHRIQPDELVIHLLCVDIFHNPNSDVVKIKQKANEVKQKIFNERSLEFVMVKSQKDYNTNIKRLAETAFDPESDPMNQFVNRMEYLRIKDNDYDLTIKDGIRNLKNVQPLIDQKILPDFKKRLYPVPNPLGFLLKLYGDQFRIRARDHKNSDVFKPTIYENDDDSASYNYIMYMVSSVTPTERRIIGEFKGNFTYVSESDVFVSVNPMITIDVAYLGLGLCYQLARKTYHELREMQKFQKIAIDIASENSKDPKHLCRCFVKAAQDSGLEIFYKGKNMSNQPASYFCHHDLDSRENSAIIFHKSLDMFDFGQFSKIGMIIDHPPTEIIEDDIPSFDQFLSQHIPMLAYEYLHPSSNDDLLPSEREYVLDMRLQEFFRTLKLIFLITKDETTSQETFQDIKRKQNVEIIRLQYTQISYRYQDISHIENHRVPNHTLFYRIDPIRGEPVLLHRLNQKAYNVMRNLIKNMSETSEYTEYLKSVPDLKHKSNSNLVPINFRVYDSFAARDCIPKNIVIDTDSILHKSSYSNIYRGVQDSYQDISVETKLIKDSEIFINDIHQWEESIRFQNIAADVGLAPRILQHWKCSAMDIDGELVGDVEIGFTTMDKIRGISFSTLTHKIKNKKINRKILDVVFPMIEKSMIGLHKVNVIHGEIHGDNIIVKQKENGDPDGIFFINFENAYMPTSDDNIEAIVKENMEYLKEFE